jgi:hypothetical protein
MEEFYNKITNWLVPKGFTEVYSNHPLSEKREFHFSKEGVRVICVEDFQDYCYLHADVLKNPFNLAIKTGKYEIGTEKLDELFDYVSENRKSIMN